MEQDKFTEVGYAKVGEMGRVDTFRFGLEVG